MFEGEQSYDASLRRAVFDVFAAARMSPDCESLLDTYEDERIRFNDGGCDPAGRFWMGTMAYDETQGAGSVYRLDADGDLAERSKAL